MIVGEATNMITRLYLMPTQNCNCDCTYCYIPHSERIKKCDHDNLRSVVNKFMDNLDEQNYYKDPEIRFIGGEPYIDINFILELSNSFLDRFKNGKIIINTNGTLINKGILELVKTEHRNRLIHIVSLDGIEEIHNKRRISRNGQNTFEKTVSGIRLLKSLNMPVYINMVLDNYSVNKLNDFMLYLKSELDIYELSVSLLFNPDNPLSNELKYDLIKKAYNLAKENGILLGGHHRLLLGLENPDFMCNAGDKTILISSDKKIYACQRFVGRKEAELFSASTDFNTVACGKCVSNECYSHDNRQLGKKIFELYSNGLSSYRSVNSLDKVLFGVI